MSIARAQLDNVPGVLFLQIFLQNTGHDARMPHPGVEPAEIAARAQGRLILRRQDIQQFRQDNAFHGASKFYSTSNSAPWQVNPAPNDDIHQSPPGAFSASAACRTNKTEGLLMFPCSRSTASLWRKSWPDNRKIFRRARTDTRRP